ncbi:hypothetical protein CALVIDRAFT_526828 [Calocera viscosa TUFC12733]|uniref:DUF6532 domain-containing protein n=1 Tax=Calocera viscosa (strain TUFC12733) TaxID=1330018 RepID=A0A167N2S9_CALVF|nr:hypothetical protein CALVIDRAFT_526828 [Calocera viscosa TUFC12733]
MLHHCVDTALSACNSSASLSRSRHRMALRSRKPILLDANATFPYDNEEAALRAHTPSTSPPQPQHDANSYRRGSVDQPFENSFHDSSGKSKPQDEEDEEDEESERRSIDSLNHELPSVPAVREMTYLHGQKPTYQQTWGQMKRSRSSSDSSSLKPTQSYDPSSNRSSPSASTDQSSSNKSLSGTPSPDSTPTPDVQERERPHLLQPRKAAAYNLSAYDLEFRKRCERDDLPFANADTRRTIACKAAAAANDEAEEGEPLIDFNVYPYILTMFDDNIHWFHSKVREKTMILVRHRWPLLESDDPALVKKLAERLLAKANFLQETFDPLDATSTPVGFFRNPVVVWAIVLVHCAPSGGSGEAISHRKLFDPGSPVVLCHMAAMIHHCLEHYIEGVKKAKPIKQNIDRQIFQRYLHHLKRYQDTRPGNYKKLLNHVRQQCRGCYYAGNNGSSAPVVKAERVCSHLPTTLDTQPIPLVAVHLRQARVKLPGRPPIQPTYYYCPPHLSSPATNVMPRRRIITVSEGPIPRQLRPLKESPEERLKTMNLMVEGHALGHPDVKKLYKDIVQPVLASVVDQNEEKGRERKEPLNPGYLAEELEHVPYTPIYNQSLNNVILFATPIPTTTPHGSAPSATISGMQRNYVGAIGIVKRQVETLGSQIGYTDFHGALSAAFLDRSENVLSDKKMRTLGAPMQSMRLGSGCIMTGATLAPPAWPPGTDFQQRAQKLSQIERRLAIERFLGAKWFEKIQFWVQWITSISKVLAVPYVNGELLDWSSIHVPVGHCSEDDVLA